MTREQIESRIKSVQEMHAKETNASTLETLETLARCLEHLIMMDAEDE